MEVAERIFIHILPFQKIYFIFNLWFVIWNLHDHIIHAFQAESILKAAEEFNGIDNSNKPSLSKVKGKYKKGSYSSK